MKKTTEFDSLYNNLEMMETQELLTSINQEDHKVAKVIKQSIPLISELVNTISKKMKTGGRLFYTGSGTSGRLGIIDASECPPTFGVPNSMVIGLIAGGDSAIRSAVEAAEDDTKQAWKDLKKYNISEKDVVIGISASGTTPYVLGGLKNCYNKNIYTASITCNEKMEISNYSNISIIHLVGPEFITGSTRMKAGTAQKMTLNMITTSVMIKLGHVLDNKMIDMHINNRKLKERACKMIEGILNISKKEAESLLEKYGNVRSVINNTNEKEV